MSPLAVLLTLLSSFLLAGILPAQEVPPRPPVVTWSGESLDVVAGVNNGVRKMLVRTSLRRGQEPRIRFEVRRTAPAKLRDESFAAYRRPETLFYAGSDAVAADGNDWDRHRWVDRSDFELHLLHPVRSVGVELLQRFSRFRWDVSPARVPWAILVLVSPDNQVYFPLRDLRGFAFPKKALLLDRVPIERFADRVGLLADIRDKLLTGATEQKLEAVEQLGNFQTRELGTVAADLLALTEHADERLSRAASAFVRARRIPDVAAIRAAEADLASEEPAVVRAALRVLERAAPQSISLKALRRAASRSDLPEPLPLELRGAVRRLETHAESDG